MIWFIVLNIVMSNGDVYTDVHFPNKPEYNNEQECNAAGQELVDKKQIEIGTNAGTTFFICKSITADDIKAATQKPGQNI
jgi:hypothetical protein